MKAVTTATFERDYAALPVVIRERTKKKLAMFLKNPRHPSLRIKKMEDPRGIWEGSITKNYRFTFQMQEDTYVLRRVGTHDILRTP